MTPGTPTLGSPTLGTPTRSWSGLVGVLAAQAVAWTGTRLCAIALPWFVLTSTGSAAQTGAVVFAQMGPYVVAQALAGPLLDRIGPRRISITGDLVATAALAAVPLLYLAGALPLSALMALVAVMGIADGPANAAKSIFLPRVTRDARVPLERGTGLSGALERLASTLGPAAGGLVVATVGGVYALWITAALISVGSVLIAATAPRRTPDDREPTGGYLRQLRDGAGFLRRDRLLRALTGMVAVTNLLDTAMFSVLLPVWALHTGHGPAVVGLVIAVMSGCSIGASLLAAAVAHRLPRRLVYLVGFLMTGAPRFLILLFSPPLWLVLAVFGVAGFSSGFLNPILNTVQFERIPARLLGRVRTLSVALMWSGIPFGGLIAGGLIGWAGLRPALALCGLGYFTATMLPALSRSFAELDRDAPEPSPPTGPPPTDTDTDTDTEPPPTPPPPATERSPAALGHTSPPAR